MDALHLQEEIPRVCIDAHDTVQDVVTEIASVYGVHVAYYLAKPPEEGHSQFFVRTTYPREWVGHYVLHNYVEIDPIIREGFARLLPFDWSEVKVTDAAAELMADAVRHGLHPQGYAWPLMDKHRRRALFCINGDHGASGWSAFLDEFKAELGDLAVQLHTRVMRELFDDDADLPALGSREIETLNWAARGKTCSEIGTILGISGQTVKVYWKSASAKLGTNSVRMAIEEARRRRLLD